MHLLDRPAGYGPVSRALHWGMAALFVLQFAAAGLHLLGLHREAPYAALWSLHVPLGVTLLGLALLRGAWGLLNLARRPRDPGAAGLAARLGHGALYAGMIAVPALAVLRSVGNGREVAAWGVQLLPPAA